MSGPVDSYVKGIFNMSQQYAAWPPHTKLRIGDIGILEGMLFQYRSNLDSMGIQFSYHSANLIDFDHSSGFTFGGAVQAGADGLVGGPVGGVAKAQLSFASSGSFVFQATGCSGYEIDNKLKLAKEIRQLYKRQMWDPEWVVVQSVVEVQRAAIIVANSKGGQIEISASGGFPVGPAPLARAQGSLTVTARSGDFTEYLGQQGLTPMFGMLRVKRNIFEIAADLLEGIQYEGEAVEWAPFDGPQHI